METAAPSLTEEDLYKKVFWRIVPLLIFCYTVSYLDRVNVAFAKLRMAHDIGLSDTAFGAGAGIFFVGYFFFQVPSNLVLERVGARRWLALLMVVWSLLSASFVFTHGVRSYAALRFLLGAAEAGFYPGILVYLTQWFPSTRRARVLAPLVSAIPLAGIFGNPLSGWILSHFGAGGLLLGWQWMFLLEAAPALLGGLGIWYLLDDCIEDAAWLSAEEKRVLAAALIAEHAQMPEASPRSFNAALKSGRLWLLAWIDFAIVMGQYGLTFWIPSIVRATGVRDSFHIGLLSAIPFVCAIVAMQIAGRTSDRMRERRWHMMVPACIAAAGFAVTAVVRHPAASIAALSVSVAGVLVCTMLFWALPPYFLAGKSSAGGTAVINSFGNLAGFVSPFLVGYLVDLTHSSAIAMDCLALFMVASAVGVWRIPAAMVNR